jgi:hypothetical protein
MQYQIDLLKKMSNPEKKEIPALDVAMTEIMKAALNGTKGQISEIHKRLHH